MGWGAGQTTCLGVHVSLGIQESFLEEVASKPGFLGYSTRKGQKQNLAVRTVWA